MSQQLTGFRLSPQQRHILTLQQKHPQLSRWSHCVLSCAGEVDKKRLAIAINCLIERHEILRTSFQALDGMTLPLQVINEISPIDSIPQKQWSIAGEQPSQEELQELLRSWPEVPPDLTAGSGLQVAFVSCPERSPLLLLALPTLCADAATWQLLAQELSYFYTVSGPVNPVVSGLELAEEPMQYADLAEWQNELLESEDTEDGRQYWETQSTDYLDPQLPFAIQGFDKDKFSPRSLLSNLSVDLSDRAIRFAQENDISIRSLCLATFEVLLSRLTETKQFTLALTLDGRKYAELAEVAGPVAKVIPLSAELTAGASFIECVRAVEGKLQELEQCQEYFAPTESLPKIGFEYIERSHANSTASQPFSLLLQTDSLQKLDLQLRCDRSDDTLSFEWHYSSQRFTHQGIEQIAQLYETLLGSVLESATAVIEQLALPGTIPNRPTTVSPPPPFPTVSAWIAAQTARTPDRIALVDRQQQLTYQNLEERTNQLAHYLQSLGIGLEERVIVFGDRSVDLMIAIFGILKAGAAYVPVDTGTPAVALQQRIETVEPKLVITLAQHAECLPASVPVLYLDSDRTLLAEQPATPPNAAVAPENLAYIIFTSGSTGQPKGVAVEHRQLTNYVCGIRDRIHSPEGGRWALASTLAADLGHTVVFPCLCLGHSLHVLTPERCLDAVAFAEDMERWQIDVLKLVPAHLRSLLALDSPAVLPKQQLISGGEALDWPLVDRIHALAPNCHILNHYGPTETTVGVLTYSEANSTDPRDTATVPLGFPLANSQVYVLDANQQPVPPGVPGTLYIGGAGVARGYWQQPELTAAAFVTDPFSSQPEARLYDTGDRARYRYDGAIEFLGRQDQQVKVRGFRVELAAIEAALLRHEDIREAAVVLSTQEGQIVAYVVPQTSPGPAVADLRADLQAQLPEPMVPTAIAPLEALPRLANGKCDRQALAARPLPSTAREFVAPRTNEEHTLAQLWSQVLGREPIGIHDNFFELGGDSILCIQMVGRASQLGLRFTPKQLFEQPTIAELATVVETASAITAEQGPVSGPVPLTPIQQWFFAQNNPDRHHWNQAVFLQSSESLDPDALQAALQAILAHHDGLRSQYRPSDAGWQQEVPADCPAPELAIFDFSELPGDRQQQTLEDQAAQLQTGLDLAAGRLIQVGLFVLGPQQPDYLFLACHHLVIDGVSWQVLLTDLLAAYQQLQADRSPSLPPKTTSFQTWATRLQDYAQSATLLQELEYWLAQLQAPSVVLPQDGDRATADLAHNLAQQATVECVLPADLTQALLQEVPAAYQTRIDDLLLTALVLAVGQWASNYNLRLDLEGYGRQDLFPEVDISRTVGWFTTLYPVHLSLETPQDLSTTIKTVKETLRQVPQQGIGFGLLRHLCTDANVRAQLQAAPPAQIRFNYLGQTDRFLTETGPLTLAKLSTGPGRAPSSQRLYLLDISGGIQSGQLQLQWRYNTQQYHQATIETLAQRYLTCLQEAIAHCQDPDAGSYTPSDFPDANLDGDDLDQLMAQLL
ncbi:MAG: amino acid adenylation domain-containing protein [Cyanobacteria bacterium J06641_5]